jgi:hypothetical protein
MKLKFPVALAAAILLTGAGFSYNIDEAWGHGGGGGFGGGGFGGFHGGGHGFGGSRGMGAKAGARPNFQRGRTGNISKHHLNNSHFKSRNGKLGTKSSHPSAIKVQAGKPGSKPDFKKLSLSPQFKHASVSKHNIWANKLWGGKDWHHHHDHWFRWSGAVFWPYFEGDYFCYGFWPEDCYDVYWGYGPDTLLWGAFWPYGEYYADEPAPNEASDAGGNQGLFGFSAQPASKPREIKRPDASTAAEACSGFAPSIGDLPIQKLEGIVDASDEQRTALADLKAALAHASDILRKACPSEPPLTPVARLDAMERRLQAMVRANVVVKDPFVHLYGLLTDEQKKRLQAVSKPAPKPQLANAKNTDVAGLCASQASFTSVPAEQISATLTLTGEQQQALEKLKAASAQASDELKNSCPASIPDTLEGRLNAAQQRVAALVGAVDTVRPAVTTFYASLTDEQKATLSIQPAPQKRG